MLFVTTEERQIQALLSSPTNEWKMPKKLNVMLMEWISAETQYEPTTVFREANAAESFTFHQTVAVDDDSRRATTKRIVGDL